MQLVSSAPGKLNLYLKVISRRPDGFHNLSGLMVKIPQWCDFIRIEASNSFECFCSDSALPQGENNLAGQAALLYAQTAKIPPSWRIVVDKNLPCGAGLGGGSSDAAEVLKLLNRYYGLLSNNELAGLALKIGSDVPFFLGGAAAWAAGVGEKLSNLSVAPGIYALVTKPSFDSITKAAYQSLSVEVIHPDLSGNDKKIRKAIEKGSLAELINYLYNDFAPGLESMHDWYGQIRLFLQQNDLPGFSITGSGSAGFVLGDSETKLNEVKIKLDKYFPDQKSKVSRVGE